MRLCTCLAVCWVFLRRSCSDSDSDLEALRERDAREIELGLGETLERADVEIDNTGTLDEFRRRVREVLGVRNEAGGSEDAADSDLDDGSEADPDPDVDRATPNAGGEGS